MAENEVGRIDKCTKCSMLLAHALRNATAAVDREDTSHLDYSKAHITSAVERNCMTPALGEYHREYLDRIKKLIEEKEVVEASRKLLDYTDIVGERIVHMARETCYGKRSNVPEKPTKEELRKIFAKALEDALEREVAPGTRLIDFVAEG